MTLEHTSPKPGVVLAKAAVRAAEQLGLTQAQMAAVLALDGTAVGRLGQYPAIDPASRGGESGLLLVRLADGLSALAGEDKDWVQNFMRSPNKVTGGVPVEQIEQIEGLVRVLGVVDTIRSRV